MRAVVARAFGGPEGLELAEVDRPAPISTEVLVRMGYAGVNPVDLNLFAGGGMPDSNYITGPTYLLNWGIVTTDKVNFNRVRREAIGFTEMILRLGRTPRSKLRTYTLK